MSKTKWERFLILIAGPAMNLILAVIVMWGVLYQGAEVPAYEQEPPVVGRVVEDSPAARAGIGVGERIVSVADRAVETWDDLFVAVMPRAEREIPVVVRDLAGRERTLDVVPEARTEFEMGDLGVGPEMRPQIISVTPGDPADRAGIEVGDIIVAVDGEDAAGGDFVERISTSAGTPLTFTIRRGDGTEQVRVTPEMQGRPRHDRCRLLTVRAARVGARVLRGLLDEPGAELRVVRADLPDAGGPADGRDVAAATGGPGRHRPAFGRRRPGGLGGALQP